MLVMLGMILTSTVLCSEVVLSGMGDSVMATRRRKAVWQEESKVKEFAFHLSLAIGAFGGDGTGRVWMTVVKVAEKDPDVSVFVFVVPIVTLTVQRLDPCMVWRLSSNTLSIHVQYSQVQLLKRLQMEKEITLFLLRG
ncbi:hypothetical protein DFH94DRAFT_659289, partial [Russula ochroleuca]